MLRLSSMRSMLAGIFGVWLVGLRAVVESNATTIRQAVCFFALERARIPVFISISSRGVLGFGTWWEIVN
jgi:hypothetical protein